MYCNFLYLSIKIMVYILFFSNNSTKKEVGKKTLSNVFWPAWPS